MKTLALLLHRGDNGRLDASVHDVIEKATASPEDPKYYMGAGRVLGNEEVNEVVGALTDTKTDSLTLFDERILAASSYALAWWIPAAQRTIHFRTSNDELKSLTFEFPSQVAVFSRGSLFFASVKAKKARPKADTALFNSPLPNLYRGGRFCTGTAGGNIPQTASVRNIPAFEQFLFDTINTHIGSELPLSGIARTDDLIDAIEVKKGGFPTSRLVPMGATLNEWIAAIDMNRA